MAHTVVVLSNGDAYGWGDGRKGQLGEPAAIVWSPRKIEGIAFAVKKVACGREFTYLVGDPEGGHHIVLGLNKWNIKTSMPESVGGWKDIGASWGSIYVLYGNGHLLSWGRNDHGQLAPADLPELQNIAIGSEHALGLTLDGKLVAWGWGEHGNCGPELDDDGDVKGRWNEIPLHGAGTLSSASGIGAGCASSWVFVDDITKAADEDIGG
jgi:protein ATS1